MAEPVTEMVHLTAQIPAPLRDRLKAVADADDRTVSHEVRQAIKNHVERLEAVRIPDIRETSPDHDPDAGPRLAS